MKRKEFQPLEKKINFIEKDFVIFVKVIQPLIKSTEYHNILIFIEIISNFVNAFLKEITNKNSNSKIYYTGI